MTAEKYKKRLDKFLVDEGLVSSRERAQELIREGKVLVNGREVIKNSFPVTPDDKVDLQEGELPWVSRGALKLEKALDYWSIDVSGKKCLDVGACTGGFTQVLLKKGADKVYALDVGRDQLAEELKQDPKVINIEGVNARDIPKGTLPERIDLAVIDVSYISLALVLPKVTKFLQEKGEVAALIKPQFEVGRKNVRKGIVTDDKNHLKAQEKVKEAGEEAGLESRGIISSPITGGKGNKEFLAYFHKNSS